MERIADLGTRLKVRRVLAGMGQADASRATGIPQTSISRYERGEADAYEHECMIIEHTLALLGIDYQSREID